MSSLPMGLLVNALPSESPSIKLSKGDSPWSCLCGQFVLLQGCPSNGSVSALQMSRGCFTERLEDWGTNPLLELPFIS